MYCLNCLTVALIFVGCFRQELEGANTQLNSQLVDIKAKHDTLVSEYNTLYLEEKFEEKMNKSKIKFFCKTFLRLCFQDDSK